MGSHDLQKNGALSTDDLFQTAQEMFPARLRENGWYLTVIAALVALNKPQIVGTLYSYLISQPEYATPTQRQALVRRMRGVLVRCCLINGVPVAMEATAAIAALEREEDKDYGFVRKNWKLNKANRESGAKGLARVLGGDTAAFRQKFDAHKDILFVIIDVGYGLGLAQGQEFDVQETELVMLPAVMCQNLVAPTMFHLRGSLNVGVERDEVEQIHQTIEFVARSLGKELEPVGRVADVQDEMLHLLTGKAN